MVKERAVGFIIFRKISGSVQYLLLQTSYGRNHWTPPKGHVDPGEDDMQTAYRETMEEAGILKEHLKIHEEMRIELKYPIKGGTMKTTIYLLAELLDPKTPVKLSHEHQDFKWLDLKSACDLAGFPDMQEALHKCQTYID